MSSLLIIGGVLAVLIYMAVLGVLFWKYGEWWLGRTLWAPFATVYVAWLWMQGSEYLRIPGLPLSVTYSPWIIFAVLLALDGIFIGALYHALKERDII